MALKGGIKGLLQILKITHSQIVGDKPRCSTRQGGIQESKHRNNSTYQAIDSIVFYPECMKNHPTRV